MGLAYYTADQIQDRQAEVQGELKRQPSWVLREGRMTEWLAKTDCGSRIVDFGAGSGEMEKQLIELGFTDISAVDIDNYLQDIGPGVKVNFVKADLSRDRLEIPDASADIVFAIQIFEHLENPWHCAREIMRIAKPGGRIYFSIPDVTSLINRLSFLFTGRFKTYGLKNNHISIYTGETFRKLWGDGAEIKGIYHSKAWIRFFGRKLRLPGDSWLGKRFSRKIAYCLVRR